VSGRWRRFVLAGSLALVAAFGAIAATAIAEPDSGPSHALIAAIEDKIRENETLHYQVHRVLGKAFSFCPCTARLSRSQYEKAAFHRPSRR